MRRKRPLRKPSRPFPTRAKTTGPDRPEPPAAPPVDPRRGIVVEDPLRRPAPPQVGGPDPSTDAEAVRRLLALPPRRRFDALVESDDAAGLLAALPEDDFALTVLEVGLGEADLLLAHATPDQLVHLGDLRLWRDDAFDLDGAAELFDVLQEAGPEALLRWIDAADDAVLAVLLSRLAVVASDDVPLPERVEEEALGAPFTLDGVFLLFPRAPGREGLLRSLLTLLFDQRHETYLWLCTRVQWMLESEVEEDLRARREGRLVEHGFAPFERAAEIFAPLDPEALRPDPVVEAWRGSEARTLFHAPSELPEPTLFLGRAAERLAPADADTLRESLERVARLVLGAEKMDPGDPEHRRRARIRASRTVSIGIERIAGGDAGAGAGLLTERPILHLFRIGATVARELHVRAAALSRENPLLRERTGRALLPAPLREVVDACRLPRPQRPAGRDDEGSVRYEPFAALHEIAAAREALETAGALARFLERGLGIPFDFATAIDLRDCLPDAWTDVRADDVLRTAVVQAGSTGHLRFQPVDLIAFHRFIESKTEPSDRGLRLIPSFREEAETVLAGRHPPDDPEGLPRIRDFLRASLEALEDELGGLDPAGPFDLRFVGGFVRRP